MIIRRLSLLLLLLIVAACASTTPTPIAVPTLTLIPPTATITPSPIPPTATSANLPEPGDLNTPAVTAEATEPPILTNLTGSELIQQDPVALSLTLIAERLVAKQTDLPSSQVKVVDVRTMIWTDSTLNCPQAGSQAVPTQTDGYRILLSAGTQEFLYHTDVDRVVPCNQEDEQLPEGVTLPPQAIAKNAINETTPESAAATAESTSQP